MENVMAQDAMVNIDDSTSSYEVPAVYVGPVMFSHSDFVGCAKERFYNAVRHYGASVDDAQWDDTSGGIITFKDGHNETYRLTTVSDIRSDGSGTRSLSSVIDDIKTAFWTMYNLYDENRPDEDEEYVAHCEEQEDDALNMFRSAMHEMNMEDAL